MSSLNGCMSQQMFSFAAYTRRAYSTQQKFPNREMEMVDGGSASDTNSISTLETNSDSSVLSLEDASRQHSASISPQNPHDPTTDLTKARSHFWDRASDVEVPLVGDPASSLVNNSNYVYNFYNYNLARNSHAKIKDVSPNTNFPGRKANSFASIDTFTSPVEPPTMDSAGLFFSTLSHSGTDYDLGPVPEMPLPDGTLTDLSTAGCAGSEVSMSGEMSQALQLNGQSGGWNSSLAEWGLGLEDVAMDRKPFSSLGNLYNTDELTELSLSEAVCEEPSTPGPVPVSYKSYVREAKAPRATAKKLPHKKHKCPVCHKVFKRPSSFKIHFSIHTGDKQYKCRHEKCGKCFNVKSNLTRHEKLHMKAPQKKSLCN